MIVGTVPCEATEPSRDGAEREVELASPALPEEALSDLCTGVASIGSPRAALSLPAIIGSPIVLALAPAGSVNVGIGSSVAVEPVPSAAVPGCGLGPGLKRLRALEPPVDP
jgi:hypothetical protein